MHISACSVASKISIVGQMDRNGLEEEGHHETQSYGSLYIKIGTLGRPGKEKDLEKCSVCTNTGNL